MTLTSLRSAVALAALLCLPSITIASTAAAQTGSSEETAFAATTNFNQPPARVRATASKSQGSSAAPQTARAGKARPAKITRGKSPALVARVKTHARAAGVPVSIAVAIVHQESGFHPHVTGGAGEIGLMQLKCQTARGMGFSGSCEALYNPDTNLRYGMKYLKAALKRGSVGYYNAGIHARRLPAAARKYAASVAAWAAGNDS